ncbi:MAG: fatty acid desaturase [Mycobacteriaceae bacterium]
MTEQLLALSNTEFDKFMEKVEQIEGQQIASAIPRELMTPNVKRGILGFATSSAIYVGSIFLVSKSPKFTWPLLWGAAGLGGWGLHCIAHDCGHGSFSSSRKFNYALGHIALLPLAYPFHSWRHVHNLHHGHTNSLELDTDWRPVPEEVFQRMSLKDRAIYFSTRTWAVWAGTINYWAESGFRAEYFPKKTMRDDVRKSSRIVLGILVPYLTALGFKTGVAGIAKYFLVPWVATHAWFSITTLMHHSSDDIPYLRQEDWTRNASKLLVTTDYIYPKVLHFLTHNISVHTAHHVAPVVPFYNLPEAQKALKFAYPGMVREEVAKPSKLWRIISRCRFYDPISGFYSTKPMQKESAA